MMLKFMLLIGGLASWGITRMKSGVMIFTRGYPPMFNRFVLNRLQLLKGVVMNQPTLFDMPTAIEARDEAIERVETNAEPEWKTNCLNAIQQVALVKAEFSTDDVWEYLHQNGIEAPHENRAIGALMIKAGLKGWITTTDRYVNSLRPACHRRPVRVWRSLIF